MYEDYPILNEDVIGQFKEFSDEPGVIEELFTTFIEDGEKLTAQIDKALAGDDRDDLKVAVHTLKGVAGTIGASRLYQVTKAADEAVNTNDIDRVKTLQTELKTIYRDTIASVREEFNV